MTDQDKEKNWKRVEVYQYEIDGLLSKIEELDGRLEPIRDVWEKWKNRPIYRDQPKKIEEFVADALKAIKKAVAVEGK